MAHRPEDIRNVALVGAGGAGKTTLAETLLLVAKAISRLGTVPEKNTVSDWDDDEKDRQHSILAAPLHLTWEGTRIHLIDTPGALDFVGEPMCALAAVETAVICVNAHDGIGVATRRLYKAIQAAGLSCCIVVTRCETDNIDGLGLLDEIQQTFGEQAVPLNLPDAFGSSLTDVVDLFAENVPDALKDAAEKYRQQTIDRVVEVDDALLEKYFESGEVSQEEIEQSFPRALRSGNIVPVLHVSAEKEVGLRKLLTFLVHDCPTPAEIVVRKAVDAEGEAVVVDPAGAFSAQVWKIQIDPHVGKLAYLRVWSGTLAGKTQFTVARTGNTERIGDLLEIQGKEMHVVPQAVAGDLVAVAKIDDVRIGDTIRDAAATWTFVPIHTPVPKVTLAVLPKNRGDEVKLGPELHKLDEGDSTFVAEREATTGEMVVRGMSSLHVDVMLKRLARKKVEALTRQPRIPYMETISGKGEAMFRHKKQSGGRGQFAEVHLRVAPLGRGGKVEFVDKVVGGSIPRQFIPAVEKGIRETCAKGVLAGYPFTEVEATVHFGKFHDVDSDEFSFKLASSQAFKLAVANASPIILEPIMEVEIEVPSRFMGDISGDLNSRRGRIQGMTQEQDTATIRAEVPLSEMLNYSTELRSLTAGEGDYTFQFGHYEPMPAHIAKDVVASAKKVQEAAHA